jgi:hypothetical protein
MVLEFDDLHQRSRAIGAHRSGAGIVCTHVLDPAHAVQAWEPSRPPPSTCLLPPFSLLLMPCPTRPLFLPPTSLANTQLHCELILLMLAHVLPPSASQLPGHQEDRLQGGPGRRLY